MQELRGMRSKCNILEWNRTLHLSLLTDKETWRVKDVMNI